MSSMRRFLLLAALVVPSVADDCSLEPGYAYNSLWNETSLRVCPGVSRPEKVCIVGGGSSGTHLGWLLKRRGFSPVVFERNNRLGGEIWTRYRTPSTDDASNDDDDDVTRELGAAFLSPDYDEVRALLQRYGMSEQPVNAISEMRFHVHYPSEQLQSPQGNGELPGSFYQRAVPPSEWAAHWTAAITNSTDEDGNDALINAALDKYVQLHLSIFGDMGQNRFPPEPATDERLAMIQGSGLEFLLRNKLEVLHPLFYQFFVLQGMGRLDTMPAYYLLKWVNPATLSAGGFGNDPSYPLAMLPEGFGAMVDALANEVGLDVRMNTTVISIDRSGDSGSAVRLVVRSPGPSGATVDSEELCDMLALSGPITEFVRGSNDGTRKPILSDPTVNETDLFAPKEAMQFLISLLELDQASADASGFETLEFWPANFQTTGGVIVRRDVAYSEQNASKHHRIGGLQSYSYWPWPRCDEAHHIAAQELWARNANLTVVQVLARAFFDTYLFHYDDEGITSRKPWRLADAQSPFEGSHTIYVGGTAGFETVEDSLQFNLELVNRLFDQPSVKQPSKEDVGDRTWPGVAHVVPHLEQIKFSVPCDLVAAFATADASTWTPFLSRQKGFVRKTLLLEPASDIPAQNCSIWSTVQWASLELWKQGIDSDALADTQSEFEAAFTNVSGGYGPLCPPSSYPEGNGDNGLEILLDVPLPIDEPFPTRARWAARLESLNTSLPVLESSRDYNNNGNSEQEPIEQYPTGNLASIVELIKTKVASCSEADVAAFVTADNATWTAFLNTQPGFVRKVSLLEKNGSQCFVWSRTMWATRRQWEAIPSEALAEQAQKFSELLGYDPPYHRVPDGQGYVSVLLEREAPRGPRMVVLGGVDLVAFQCPGCAPLVGGVDHDVRGSPDFSVVLSSELFLPPGPLRALHPGPYEFWFSSSANAATFTSDWRRYVPRIGGHCTHGVATLVDGDLTAAQLVDGRLGFTCVNTTEWGGLVPLANSNTTGLYMNSCGMYSDFVLDPAKDATAAEAVWAEWFGEDWAGPINDACVQDGYTWDGNCIGGLLPPQCTIM